MFRPPLLVRMIRLAPKEMFMAFISGFLAVYGVNAFNAPAATQTAPPLATQTAPPGRGELTH